MPALWELADLATPWAIHVAATLRIADHIAAGIDRIAPLAEAALADRDALQRVLRHLVAKEIFEEPEPGRFALNDNSRQLLDPVLRGGFDLDLIGGRMAYPWSTLLTAVRTGRPAYHEVFGRPFWDDLDANPAVAESFDQLMGPGHGDPDPEILPDPAAWSSIRTVVDVGGGTGTLLAAVLRAHPETQGILVDLPRTVARAIPAERMTTAAQSFFDPLPAGADLYFMKSVLSDWPDREATAILKRCAEAMIPTSRLVLVNGVSPAETANPELLMLVLVGGRARTLADFEPLAREAGLVVSATARDPNGRFLVECRRA